MVGHGWSSAGSYLADPTSPIPSHCASIVMTSTLRVNHTKHDIPITLPGWSYFADCYENVSFSWCLWVSIQIPAASAIWQIYEYEIEFAHSWSTDLDVTCKHCMYTCPFSSSQLLLLYQHLDIVPEYGDCSLFAKCPLGYLLLLCANSII